MENLDSIDKQTLEYLKQDYEEIKKDQSTNTENKQNKNESEIFVERYADKYNNNKYNRIF